MMRIGGLRPRLFWYLEGKLYRWMEAQLGYWALTGGFKRNATPLLDPGPPSSGTWRTLCTKPWWEPSFSAPPQAGPTVSNSSPCFLTPTLLPCPPLPPLLG